MINHNVQDRIDMAKDIADVRRLGSTNMFDRARVIEELYDMGHDFTAEYLEENKGDYTELLQLSGDY